VVECTFTAILEDRPGEKWRQSFVRRWPAYRAWCLRGGVAERPTYLACRRAIAQHMPEWTPIWEALSDLAGGGDVEARFLSMWRPPPYIAGCSQAVWSGAGGPALVRNYDYPPDLIEGVWLATRWTGQKVVAMSDCLCGALDGINESGLAASLSFGGRKVVGPGFGIPLVLRYVLEFCATTQEAAKVLSRIPIHMTYSITLLDRRGDGATVYVAPDRPAEVLPAHPIANHQHAIEWPEHARATNSVQRQACLAEAVSQASSLDGVVAAMLRPPLYQTAYNRGYGTLYTSVYVPSEHSAELIWPNGRWTQAVNDFHEGSRTVALETPRGEA
jgi:predicted choloylglycine hydrolase